MTEQSQRSSRRRFLTGIGALTAVGVAGCSGSDTADTAAETDGGMEQTETTASSSMEAGTETIVSVPGDRVPENVALGPDGALYFGITAGELRRIPADRVGETGLSVEDTEMVASLPGAIGVETAPDGTAYVAVATRDDSAGVWSVSPSGQTAQVTRIDGFPNDVLYDADRDRMLVTESRTGAVYSVTPDGDRTTWLDDERLATESFGANGLTRDENGDVYVAVTRAAGETGRLVRAPVESDGTAGPPSTFLEGEAIFGADGITVRGTDIYVAANGQNRVVRVTGAGETATVATAEDGLVFPSDVVLGPDRTSLFICNFANQSPEDGAILRTSL